MVITNGVRFNEELYHSLFATNADEATLVFSMSPWDSSGRPFFLNKGEPGAYNEFTYAELEGILRNLDELSDSGMLNFGNSTMREYLLIFPYGKFWMASTSRAGRQAVIINPGRAVFLCIFAELPRGRKSSGNTRQSRFLRFTVGCGCSPALVKNRRLARIIFSETDLWLNLIPAVQLND